MLQGYLKLMRTTRFYAIMLVIYYDLLYGINILYFNSGGGTDQDKLKAYESEMS